jgi:hypothetical protein
MRIERKFSLDFKVKVIIEDLQEHQAIEAGTLSEKYDLNDWGFRQNIERRKMR